MDRFYLPLKVMSRLLTQNPIALRFLMSETIFSSVIENPPIESDSIKSTPLESNNMELDLLFWGSNERNILFLIHNSNEDYFSTEAEDAFLKTLAALKLNIKDVAVVNRGKTEKSFKVINAVLRPKFCVYCEGQNEANQNVFNKFTDIDGVTCLYTYSFEEMLIDTGKKREFWNAIKEITVML